MLQYYSSHLSLCVWQIELSVYPQGKCWPRSWTGNLLNTRQSKVHTGSLTQPVESMCTCKQCMYIHVIVSAVCFDWPPLHWTCPWLKSGWQFWNFAWKMANCYFELWQLPHTYYIGLEEPPTNSTTREGSGARSKGQKQQKRSKTAVHSDCSRISPTSPPSSSSLTSPPPVPTDTAASSGNQKVRWLDTYIHTGLPQSWWVRWMGVHVHDWSTTCNAHHQ